MKGYLWCTIIRLLLILTLHLILWCSHSVIKHPKFLIGWKLCSSNFRTSFKFNGILWFIECSTFWKWLYNTDPLCDTFYSIYCHLNKKKARRERNIANTFSTSTFFQGKSHNRRHRTLFYSVTNRNSDIVQIKSSRQSFYGSTISFTFLLSCAWIKKKLSPDQIKKPFELASHCVCLMSHNINWFYKERSLSMWIRSHACVRRSIINTIPISIW